MTVFTIINAVYPICSLSIFGLCYIFAEIFLTGPEISPPFRDLPFSQRNYVYLTIKVQF